MSVPIACNVESSIEIEWVFVTCDCGEQRSAAVTNDGCTLEWDCPKCGLQRDVNA